LISPDIEKLKKFQNAIDVLAVQINNKSNGYRMLSNGDHSILIAPAYQWLSLLP